jgi:hypothetical protein
MQQTEYKIAALISAEKHMVKVYLPLLNCSERLIMTLDWIQEGVMQDW